MKSQKVYDFLYKKADEFGACLQKAGLFLSDNEAQALVEQFDPDGCKKVSYAGFFTQLREALNPRRLAMVVKCFQSLDTSGRGVIESTNLKARYCAKQHSDVIAGRKTERQVLEKSVGNFEGISSNFDG